MKYPSLFAWWHTYIFLWVCVQHMHTHTHIQWLKTPKFLEIVFELLGLRVWFFFYINVNWYFIKLIQWRIALKHWQYCAVKLEKQWSIKETDFHHLILMYLVLLAYGIYSVFKISTDITNLLWIKYTKLYKTGF